MKHLILFLAIFGILHTAHSAPANDNFADAENITGEFPVVSGDRSDSSHEIGEPINLSGITGGTVWYKWTAPAYGLADFGALFTDINNQKLVWLQVFTGTELTKLTPINRNTSITEPRTSAVVGKDQVYYIQLGGEYTSDPKNYSFFVILHTTGFDQTEFQSTSYTNDDFSQAIELTGTKVKAISYPFLATREESEPADFNKTLWWKWQAPTSGITIFSTEGLNLGGDLIVGQGDQLTNFLYTRRGRTSHGGSPEIIMKTVANQTYYMTISSGAAYQSLLSVVHLSSGPPNSGYGKGGRFTTLDGDVMNFSTISGIFTVTGITRFKVTQPVGFYIQGPTHDHKTNKWSFHLNSALPPPARATIVIEGIKNGKTVAKITKTFRVW